ncbi:glutaminyl-tRNA synthase (glutamine-hydrolyzing) subunit A [Candidatus Gottesmanbacteria bacterium RIFCSPHIGHO2_01_FULL_42_27]|uniref:Glutamyl-tRNA(Gln) amidotransferase subunit A n=2 Tax=Candidatus Gottesmaniibacteriota TaxID=1752720 RepID=A0A1F6BKC7_9BACT|nr:MAG: Glutamyl-tRNA(Gln) amidotransferase subunit A [Candidatus Gottesmanbacteria bacterium GW2011_GWA2_42_18]OGG09433.1 MAG: glutaminyl-tRNA synthase (glutamine-hydrolyzing) subunit A [Candidatus Gottesmanbacteria bacterium RIFCSPHIGHO2_01_FULL_42_27]OGG33534.1 MAG: glutaminyl-tRNA synthase (glutamine-hydrolyzing) subunit A [Candidatus Gottesmanbacteria bacterium RIFCSPLOWO2_12_FULL_42_10]OGG37381.1 MAG: glutaminyl-tRNA synthase (glutamine-hydrolyzing) subunit A [Candidatus Gottesmanbacteria 
MITDKSIKEIHLGLRKKEFSCEELIKETYGNIEKYDSRINSAITIVDKKTVLDKARQTDNGKKEFDLLTGMPFVLKDVYVTRGIRTTCASNVLADYIPQYDATVYKKLLDLGALLIGKMNQDAWGHGGSTENTDFGPTHNPWDLKRVAGGSSGGPAAAISGRMTVFAIGEDTGGSIRNPAAWCNITGLKVTCGRVSRYGAIAYASSFDTIGPMGKSAEDCAVILERIAGKDPYDATSSPASVPKYTSFLNKPLKGRKIALPKDLLGKGLDVEIKNAILKAVNKFAEIGAEIEEVTMPIFDYGLAVYYVIAPCETSSNLARYDGIRYGFDRSKFTEETIRRIMIGTYALSAGYYDAFYRKAQKARTLFIKAYQDILSKYDAILMPVNPTPPTVIGELMSDPLQNLLADFYTVTQNPVGVPSLAVPCGFTKDKLPIGMQLIGKMFTEELLLNIGHQYQQVTEWHKQKPDIIS